MAKIKLTPQEEVTLRALYDVKNSTKSEMIEVLTIAATGLDYENKSKWFDTAEQYELAVDTNAIQIKTVNSLIHKITAMNDSNFKKLTK